MMMLLGIILFLGLLYFTGQSIAFIFKIVFAFIVILIAVKVAALILPIAILGVLLYLVAKAIT